jgi:hypothetical protein
MVMEVSSELYLEVKDTPKMSKLGWLTTLATRLGKTKANQKELAKASEIGSQAHAWIENYIKAQLMHDVGPYSVISPQAMLAVGAWERWKNSVNFKPLLCEQAVWSHEHKYAGTMDLLAEINGRPTLIDWKTGKKVYEEAKLQNAAYRVAMVEMGVLPNLYECDGMIVRLPKVDTDPEFQVVPVTEDVGNLFEVFLHVKHLWQWLQVEELMDSPEVPAIAKGPTETNAGAVEAAAP